MREIGGYFEFELTKGKEYHYNALKLNSGRNALLYILITINPSKIFIPSYICDVILEPIKELNIDYEFYSINDNFEPITIPDLKEHEFFLYVNYFGINDANVKNLSKIIENLIVDNSQAFFSMPERAPTFYSPRKFFGVPDGAYLYIDKLIDKDLERDISYDYCSHLLKRFDLGAQKGYEDYENVEGSFSNRPLKLMSKLTKKILSSINYEKIKSIRKQNFFYIHKRLEKLNELNINTSKMKCPMKYPFLINKKKIKEFLINNKIYVSTYWQEVLKRVEKDSFEYNIVKHLVPLPIDQRYNLDDMKLIIEKIHEILK